MNPGIVLGHFYKVNMDRPTLPVAGLVGRAIVSPFVPKSITKDWGSWHQQPFGGWRLRSCVPVDLYSRLICRSKLKLEVAG